MKLNTYVNFPGNCKQALQFYEKHLGGKMVMLSTYDQMPEPKTIPPGWRWRASSMPASRSATLS